MNHDRVLIIAAHPDDEILGAGGTIAKYAMSGARISLLIVTDGSTSQYRNDSQLEQILQTKKEETRCAADVVGISDIFYGGLPDMGLDATKHVAVNEVIEKVVADFKPNIVFTHFYGDVNMDHQCVYRSTMVACRPTSEQTVRELYSYYVPSSTDWSPQHAATVFMPTVFVDIAGQCAEKKYEAMSCYQTELRDYPHPRSVEALRAMDQANGAHVGLFSAECFVLHRAIK